jgi:membrane protein DedA with SNARE-associated domain
MWNDIYLWIIGLPAPLLIVAFSVVVFISTGGIPIPVTMAILLAGILSIHTPGSILLLAGLWIGLALGTSARDALAYIVVREGGRWFQRQVDSDATLSSQQEEAVLPAVFTETWQWGAKQLKSPRVIAALELLRRWKAPVLALSRLTPITPVFNVAAILADIGLRAFYIPVFIGRLLFVALWLSAGIVSGTAASQGASLPEMIGIGTVIILVLLIAPTIISRRILDTISEEPIKKVLTQQKAGSISQSRRARPARYSFPHDKRPDTPQQLALK